MQSEFTVTIRLEQGATVVGLSGELDLASYPQLEHEIDRLLESAPEFVVLDLAELEFMDVAGMRSILRLDERLRAEGKRLAVAATPPPTRRLLALTGQEQALRLFESTSEALAEG
jgi:anti-anti-sigma factor